MTETQDTAALARRFAALVGWRIEDEEAYGPDGPDDWKFSCYAPETRGGWEATGYVVTEMQRRGYAPAVGLFPPLAGGGAWAEFTLSDSEEWEALDVDPLTAVLAAAIAALEAEGGA